MWLNIWPLVKSRTAISEIAAQRLRFEMRGQTYGHATVPRVINPSTIVVNVASRIQLKGL